MKIQRLFEIVYILLNKKIVTAKELASYFEVSQRTIYRDLDILSAAGIPIFTNKGKGGGISLVENFILNKSLLNVEEQNEILSALQSLQAVTCSNDDNVLLKLSLLFNKEVVNWVEIDFSDWSNEVEHQFEKLKAATLNKYIIHFDYYGTQGQKTNRNVEPVNLMFKHKSWYLKAFCLDKQEIRLFKLSRMKDLRISDQTFEPRKIDLTAPDSEKQLKDQVTLKLHIDGTMAYRVYEEFDQVIQKEDGSFEVIVTYPEDEWVYGFILSFGCYAKVLEPDHVRKIIIDKMKRTLDNYF